MQNQADEEVGLRRCLVAAMSDSGQLGSWNGAVGKVGTQG